MNDRALRVLEKYELDVTSTRRGRGAWIFETSQGLRILSEYSGSENRALFQNCVMKRLREGGYANVDVVVPNQEGALVSRDWEGNRYVVKEWYAGRECDPSNESEIFAAVQNLARLHRLMILKEDATMAEDLTKTDVNLSDSISEQEADKGKDFRENFTARQPLAEVCAWNAQLRKIRSFIRRRSGKSLFEQRFLECFEPYYAQAKEAQACLERASVGLEKLRMEQAGTLCHGDYSYHHVLMCGQEIATTNFDSCRFDFQVNDLYRFTRKVLEKHDWNVKLGIRMLELYDRVRPLPEAERQLLKARMLYPEKFRKLAGSYYGGNKAWISRQYMEKLEKSNRQEIARRGFLELL